MLQRAEKQCSCGGGSCRTRFMLVQCYGVRRTERMWALQAVPMCLPLSSLTSHCVAPRAARPHNPSSQPSNKPAHRHTASTTHTGARQRYARLLQDSTVQYSTGACRSCTETMRMSAPHTPERSHWPHSSSSTTHIPAATRTGYSTVPGRPTEPSTSHSVAKNSGQATHLG